MSKDTLTSNQPTLEMKQNIWKILTPSFDHFDQLQNAGIEEIDEVEESQLDDVLSQWTKRVNFEEVSNFILVGTHQGAWFRKLRPWLEEDKERMLILLEPNFSHLNALFFSEISNELLEHPRVLVLVPDQDSSKLYQQESVIDMIGNFCIDGFFACEVNPFLKEELRNWAAQIKEAVFKKIYNTQQMRLQSLLSPDIISYCIRNAYSSTDSREIEEGHHYLTQRPIILCGAGPSLDEEIEQIRKMKDKALIVACGSAILSLEKHGIEPDMISGICAFRAHFDRFFKNKQFERPGLSTLRVEPGVLRMMTGPRFHMGGLTRSVSVRFIDRQLGASSPQFDYGTSVFTSSLAALVRMGFKNFIFAGLNLCYHDDKKYSEGIAKISLQDKPSGSEEFAYIESENRRGEKVSTTNPWLLERDWLENFLKENSQVSAYHSGSKTLPVEGVQEKAIQEAFQLFSGKDLSQSDCLNEVWQLYAQSKSYEDKKGHIQGMYYALAESLDRCMDICMTAQKKMKDELEASDPYGVDEIIKEYEEAMKQEVAYEPVIYYIDWAIRTIQMRYLWIEQKSMNLSATPRLRLVHMTLLAERFSIVYQRTRQVLNHIMGVIDENYESSE